MKPATSNPMEVELPPDEPVLIMRRHFRAPRPLVWEALTDPRHVAFWYGGHGFQNPVCEMDVRPGGIWRHVMRTPDGAELSSRFVFLEVVPPERLSWRSADWGQGDGPHHNVMTVTLAEAASGTAWMLVTRFASLEARAQAQRIGFASVLTEGTEKVAALLDRLQEEA